MWIKRLILENFASIKVGMKTNRLELDFTNRKNKICLLVAPNGYGKTSLLSTLTPFATLGNLDVRDSSSIIIKGESGYKEIEIESGDDTYLIKHFYSVNKESHSVKSYVQKNGEELNVNGNVTSFKAIIEDELDLDINYLKLTRLGNNVTNLLDLSATERKKFLSNILNELDVYLNYFKKLTEDGRVLKTQISHLVDKIKKTGIDDINSTKESLSFLNDEMKDLEEKRQIYLIEKGKLTQQISSIPIMEVQSRHKEVVKLIEKSKKSLSKITSIPDISSVQEELKSLQDKKQALTTEIGVFSSKVSLLLQRKDEVIQELEVIDREIKKIDENEDFKSIVEICKKLEYEVNLSYSTFSSYEKRYTKKEFEDFMVALVSVQQMLDTTYELGKEPIRRVVSLMLKQVNVQNYINNGLLEADRYQNENSILLDKFLQEASDVHVECNHHTCGLFKVYTEILNLQKKEEVRRKSDESVEFYTYMNLVHQNILSILQKISLYKEMIHKLPKEREEDFLSHMVLDKLSNLQPLVDIKKYNILLTEITEYENFMEKVEILEERKRTRDLLMKSSNIEYLRDRKETLVDNLQDLIEESNYTKDQCEKKKISLTQIEESIEDSNTVLFAITSLDTLVEEEIGLSKDITVYKETVSKLDNLNIDLHKINSLLSKKEEQRSLISVGIYDYEKLTKELESQMKLYNENTYIKRAMSAKEGMPLEYINIYMSNIKETINDLLDVVYDGDIFIDDFEINSDEFRIPYVKNGYSIPDIVSASQGETSFLSIALSFAMIYESISKYNILLLDEMDGNLDKENREKFISILEILIDMVDAEQIFLISHNNLFSMYPVDIVPLDSVVDESYRLANYIIPEKE